MADDPGEISDGYHTFNELYEHRHALYIALCRNLAFYSIAFENPVWRSKLHADGTMYDGWFIMGIYKKAGRQVSYHLPIRLWEETHFAETLEQAPEWDGHTPADVLERLKAV